MNIRHTRKTLLAAGIATGRLPSQSAVDHVIALARNVDGVRRVDGSALMVEGGR